jgi:hypothetical protein
MKRTRRTASGSENARAVLRQPFPDGSQIMPDATGRFLWRVFDGDIARRPS